MEDVKVQFPMKFIDGTPVPDWYRKQINALIKEACEAEKQGLVDNWDGRILCK